MIYHNYPEGFVILDVVVWPILVQSQATGGDLQRLSWQKGLQRGGPGAAVPCGAMRCRVHVVKDDGALIHPPP